MAKGSAEVTIDEMIADKRREEEGKPPPDPTGRSRTEENPDAAQESQEGEGAEAERREEEHEATPPAASPTYQHPLLRDRTPEQIDQIFGMYERMSKELGAELTRVTAAREAAPRAEEEVPMTSQDFFQDPMTAISKVLDKQIAPLRAEIERNARRSKEDEALEAVRAEYPEVDLYLPDLRAAALRDPRLNLADRTILETAYLSLKGLESVGKLAPRGKVSENSERRAAPPQHRSSSVPPPAPRRAGEGPLRKLTESEETMRRHFRMTPAEFLKWQALEPEDVIPEEASGGRK